MATNTNRMKALYDIVMPKSARKGEADRVAQDVNEERLNDNFRTIAKELVKIWDGGEQQLNVMASRMTSTETGLAALNQVVDGIQVDTETNTSAIAQLPNAIMSQVSDTLTGYATISAMDNADAATLNAARQTTSSQVTQLANELSVEINQNTALLDEQQTVLSNLTSWVRVVAANANAGTNPGVIIGRSDSESRFKAEAAVIFFYRGDDSDAKESNADVLLAADGRLQASKVSIDEMLIDSKFDVDVVTAGGVGFLHITGRN